MDTREALRTLTRMREQRVEKLHRQRQARLGLAERTVVNQEIGAIDSAIVALLTMDQTPVLTSP